MPIGPKVVIVVLNWNGLEHLEYCLPSLLATDYPNYEVVVVDNGSTDGSAAWVRRAFPFVTLLEVGRNLGWAGGNNVGIRYAMSRKADYVALVNNDMKFDPRWIAQAVIARERNPVVSVMGFQTFGEYVPEPEAEFLQASRSWSELRWEEAVHIAGCSLFISLELFRKIGLFDEVYFFYAEEDDFESRARRAGYRMIRINVPLWHKMEGTSGRMPFRASRLSMRNHIRYYLKNESLGTGLLGILRIANIACNPWCRINPRFGYHRRLRGPNRTVGIALFLWALLWNVWHLPQTLRMRREDEAHIALARRAQRQAL